eukprot:Blabericola_migrator_1__7730@NODE_394_length_8993_cov_144_363433_g314_i0_p5_GENE_NODE_394_length_8993_cov_144_363433_g314_i0NODE_394_length_8993_cov_144_363433_g314_i0_p5_ORF_typecomplete_len166_score22_52DTW/PF03942_15/3_1e15DUF1474/PF07342_11/0_011_NODE_394_length_8993_cov_144_363433_g314_i022522749
MYNREKTVLLFPSEDAEETTGFNWDGVDRIIAVDATWQGAKMIVQNLNCKYRCVKLKQYPTTFWRYSNLSFESEYNLATAEAIYYILREIYEAKNLDATQLDDLLWIYALQMKKVQAFRDIKNTFDIAKETRERKRLKANKTSPSKRPRLMTISSDTVYDTVNKT